MIIISVKNDEYQHKKTPEFFAPESDIYCASINRSVRPPLVFVIG